MMVTPSSRAAGMRPFCSWSVNQGEYSIWRASIWATRSQVWPIHRSTGELTLASVAQGLRSTLAQPDIPALARLLQPLQRPDGLGEVSSRLNSVEIVQIRLESESLDGLVDILLNVFLGIVRGTVTVEGKTAFASDEELVP